MSLAPPLSDLAIDRLASAKQLVGRYGRSTDRDLRAWVRRGLVERYDHRPPQGRSVACYHLSALGAALVSNHCGWNLRDIPCTPGPRNQILHTLLVGETRYRLAKQGFALLSDYRNNAGKWMDGPDLLQPDMYVLEDEKPVVAVEVDRGYHPSVIRSKLNDWRERELRVWWFADGEGQIRRIQSYNFTFDRFYDVGQLNWQIC